MKTFSLLNSERLPAVVALLVAVAIALAFYGDSRHARIVDLTTDQLNMLTICVRNDYPESLKHDMVAGLPGSERFYIPFYVDLVRMISGPDHAYATGLARLLFLTTVIYVIGWWFLFRIWVNPWAAILFAFLARGVLSLPGDETWGIGGPWTMLPRTLFLALLPWPLAFWWRCKQGLLGWAFVALMIGLLANVHPLSASCVLGGILAGQAARISVDHRAVGKVMRYLIVGTAAGLAGASPILVSHASAASCSAAEPAAVQAALALRWPQEVFNPLAYLRQWLHPILLIAVVVPPVALRILFPGEWRSKRVLIRSWLFFALGVTVLAWLPLAIRVFAARFGRSLPLAALAVRGMKFIMVPATVLWVLLVGGTVDAIRQKFGLGRVALCTVPLLMIMGLLSLRLLPPTRLPSAVTSRVRFFWPEWVGPRLPPITAGQNDCIDGVLEWIEKNTADTARFIGPIVLRIAARRSVVHDHKGAGMLVEYNPAALVRWGERQRVLLNCEELHPEQLPDLYRSWGADYWVTAKPVDGMNVSYRDVHWSVYDLRGLQQ